MSLSEHWPHAVGYGAPTLVLGVVLAVESVRGRHESRRADPDLDRPRTPALRLAAVSSVGAAGVHAAVAPAHLRESLIIGTFFLGLTFAQLGYGYVAYMRPSRSIAKAGAAGALVVVLLWLWTRRIGVPGWAGGEGIEPFGEADLVASAWEMLSLASCLWALHTARWSTGPSWSGRPLGRSEWVSSAAAVVVTTVLAATSAH